MDDVEREGQHSEDRRDEPVAPPQPPPAPPRRTGVANPRRVRR